MASQDVLAPGTVGAVLDEETPDEVVLDCVLNGDPAQFEILMRRYNQRLFRVTFSILRNRAEAEEVIQESYLRAYRKLHQYAGRSSFSTWLTKIAVYEALRRRKKQRDYVDIENLSGRDERHRMMHGSNLISNSDPEKTAFSQELRTLLENAIMRMPGNHRTVFMLREIEGLSTEETAECLGISKAASKVRLHRAKSWLKQELLRQVESSRQELFGFAGNSCDRVVAEVLRRIS